MQENRVEYKRQNRVYVLNIGRFYRGLLAKEPIECSMHTEEIIIFLDNMWTKDKEINNDYFDEYVSGKEQEYFYSLKQFTEVISKLPNRKTAGPDSIFNFFIKKLTSLYIYLY